MTEMRVLTVRQPWAHAIIHLGKDVENRVRNVAGGYRGPVAIHAGLRLDKGAYHSDTLALAANAADAPSIARMPLGAIIGVVDLVSVHTCKSHSGDMNMPVCFDSGTPYAQTCSPWAQFTPGEVTHHLMLANPHPLTVPVEYRGSLGLRHLPEETARMVKELTRA